MVQTLSRSSYDFSHHNGDPFKAISLTRTTFLPFDPRAGLDDKASHANSKFATFLVEKRTYHLGIFLSTTFPMVPDHGVRAENFVSQ